MKHTDPPMSPASSVPLIIQVDRPSRASSENVKTHELSGDDIHASVQLQHEEQTSEQVLDSALDSNVESDQA